MPNTQLSAALSVAALVLGGAVSILSSGERAAEAEPSGPPLSTPIVVELFTSQGCSSCPPADRLLAQLSADPAWRDRVVPLSLHVDYWNYIGWQDPFSSAAYSERQQLYGRAFDSDRIYTPQAVVHGVTDCLGSDRSCLERAIRKAEARAPEWKLTLALTAPTEQTLRAEVRAQPIGTPTGPRPALFVVLTENGLSTPVSRGENARRTLENSHVVRHLERRSFENGQPVLVDLPLEAGWNRSQLQVSAFLQEPGTMRIVGAGRGR
ncbi:MAG TPA: DUF1223 domain-containing protein [Thermoanaerobaculia bacterium]|nr:DUF1223 domain-containing protein [Thermoanaerobaculia bacterium]